MSLDLQEQEETTEEIVQRIIDTDRALETEHDGGDSNLVRAKRREADFQELAKRMEGDNDTEREGQAATYIEQLELKEDNLNDELAA